MDTDLLNFRDEEHFSTFDSHAFLDDCPDDSGSLDGTNNFSSSLYEWEFERELNGDVALIPMSGTYNDMNLSESPPSKDDFQKIMSDWQQFINIDTDSIEDYIVDDPIIDTDNNEELSEDESDSKNFDLTSFINETTTESLGMPQRIIKAGVKKIDMRAQRYIVEENESDDDNDSDVDCNDGHSTEDDPIDVETVSENENSPVLEARDLNSLLEQFEATELPDLPCKFEVPQDVAFNTTTTNLIDDRHLNIIKLEPLDNEDNINLSPELIDILDYSTTKETPVLSETKIKTETTSTTTSNCEEIPRLAKEEQPLKTTSTTSPLATETVKSKQILEALPQELIARIKESGKRKPISVIPAIPSKRRGGPRMQDAGVQLSRNKLLKLVSNESVQLDHDYCSSPSPYPKYPKKDSGFESSEEDDRTVIRQQPTVKNADGKLMVSLLKVNTIVRNIESNQKKKLNLEEYKRRRDGFLKSSENSQCNSPNNSTCSSPLPEDENLRMKKHQEKLMKMAQEILSTAPKSNIKQEIKSPIKQELSVSIPEDMEMKTLVSIGVNTIIEEGKDTIAPVEQLEEIKPLLQKASVKIDSSSLITSLIENIPKVRNKIKIPPDSKASKVNIIDQGEDKTIVYLPKNRSAVKTASVGVQTNITLVKEDKESRYRRRRNSSSSSSSSSNKSARYRRRHKSSSSRSSRRSRGSRSDSDSSSTSYRSSSSRSRSRSRSRSITPRRTRKRTNKSPDLQHIKEVEERRVIYVGRISSSTKKEDLRKRFNKFGPIINISLHFRDHGDHYGFVTFANKLDAYEAIEHGNDDPYFPKYDLSFGGRRLFCKTSYSDLDDMRDDTVYYVRPPEDSFDNLLREVQQKLRKRHA